MSNIWEEFYNKSSELLDEAFISEENLNNYHSFVEEFKEKVNDDEELSEMLESLLNEEAEFFDKADQICRRNAKGKEGDDPDLFFSQPSRVKGQRECQGQQGEQSGRGKEKF